MLLTVKDRDLNKLCALGVRILHKFIRHQTEGKKELKERLIAHLWNSSFTCSVPPGVLQKNFFGRCLEWAPSQSTFEDSLLLSYAATVRAGLIVFSIVGVGVA